MLGVLWRYLMKGAYSLKSSYFENLVGVLGAIIIIIIITTSSRTIIAT